MSEYMEPHSVARILGAPPGYVGHEEGGQLTEPVRRRPHSVVLFDEVEKAHPSVHNVLLQVLDDGRLTDTHGRTVDFSNTIIVMTSNLGSELLLSSVGETESYDAVRDKVMGAVKGFFRPELLNRLDDVIIFNRLGLAELRDVVNIFLDTINERLASSNVSVSLGKGVCDFILQEGCDMEMGARPLRRWVEKNIFTEISRMLIGQRLPPNSCVQLSVNEETGKLAFGVERAAVNS
uniref:Uncharacterized protein TCIL3000_2_1650 n=1 Tax=Trypanosoma congolense (strain IL3000) TaxID=1068625 RepID=G0UJN2_TRYCI|nr:unnamed protein product [Trypanosoma congolense IL3000]